LGTAAPTKISVRPARRGSPVNAWIGRFLDYLVLSAGRSANTLAAYRLDLEQYSEFSHTRGLGHPNEIDARLVGDFVASLSDRGLSAASVARKLSAVRQFHRYLVREDVCRHNPARALRTPRRARHLPDILSVRQVRDLLRHCADNTVRGRRDRALVSVLYGAGLRVSEAAGLKLDDIDFTDRFIRVRGKGGRERLTPFGDMTAAALRGYIEGSRSSTPDTRGCAHVFLGRQGHGISRMSIWRTVRRLALLSGIDRAFTPHTFRHSFATHMLEAGADLRAVQSILGHSSVTTTQIYTHLDRRHLRDVHSRFHPLGDATKSP